MEKLWEVVQETLHRTTLAVGVLSTLLTIAATGLLLLLLTGDVLWLPVALFGALGGAEVFHRQQKAKLIERREMEPERLFLAALAAHPTWKPKVLKEFQYGGLRFRVLGFEEQEIPLSIAGPLCPRCTSHLAERREVRFPGRVHIEHRCACGFTQRSSHTLGQLQAEARKIAGCPS